MTKCYFFDTSALIKLYHEEVGTDCVEEIFSDVIKAPQSRGGHAW